jgi:hypothetical protein
MVKSIELQVLNKVKKAKGGSLFFIDNFTSFGNPKAVSKALERLVLSGEMQRVATGMYMRPVEDALLGKVLPSVDNIALAIAKRDRARIVPTGSYAMYKLGLTTQVPLKVVYYTDASGRRIKIGRQTITFKKASSKNLSAIGTISKLAIQAMRSIGKDKVTNEELHKIKMLLKKEKAYHLQHDLKLSPAWIRKSIGTIKTDTPHE